MLPTSFIFPVIIALALLLYLDSAEAATQYTFTTIDMPFQNTYYTAIHGMNRHGVQVGEFGTDGIGGWAGFRGMTGTYTLPKLAKIPFTPVRN
jgi:hypothetical protein